tara:strand:+ start:1817 stop:2164 length:348 start_codon:yes stop_codon:yes gene_type:complete
MDYQQIALEVFNNKLSYKDDDYITILNILMESYNKSKGIHYEVNRDLKQEEIELNECLNCGVDMNEMYDDPIDGLCICCAEEEGRCDKCESLGIMMYGEGLCSWCAQDNSDYENN